MMLRSEKKKNREISLNEPIGTDKEGNAISFLDVVEHKNENVLEKMELREDIKKLKEFVETELTERERQIIVERYGLNGEKSKTQKIIGEEYGISRSYVSRIEKRALNKLRKAFDNTYKM